MLRELGVEVRNDILELSDKGSSEAGAVTASSDEALARQLLALVPPERYLRLRWPIAPFHHASLT